MAIEIGKVSAILGTVTATDAQDVQRILHLTDVVYVDDVITTSTDGAVEIEFPDGSVMDLGRNSQSMLNSETYQVTEPFAEDVIDAEVELIQQALLAGEDVSEIAAATAAGNAIIGDEFGSLAGNIPFVERLADRVEPESGFATEGPSANEAPLTSILDETSNLFALQQNAVSVSDTFVAAPTFIVAASSDSGRSQIDGITNNTTPTLIGKGEVGSVIVITDSTGKPLGSTTVDNDGNYSITIAELPEGENELTATITDTSNNTNSSKTTVTVDTSVDKPTLKLGDDSDPNSDGKTSDKTPILTGTGEPGSVIVLTSSAGLALGSATVDSNGNYSIQTTSPLPIGDNEITATITDVAGNINSDKAIVTILVNPQAPTIVNIVDIDSDLTKIEVIGQGNLVGNKVKLYDSLDNLLGETIIGTGGVWRIDIAALSDDVIHTIRAVEVNADADDVISADSASVTVAQRTPNTAIIVDQNVDYLFTGDNDDEIKVTADDSNNKLVIDGGNGTDYVSFRDLTSAVTIDLNQKFQTVGDDVIELRNIENLKGTWNEDDKLSGNDSNNVLAGFRGNDILNGRGGNDTLKGGSGDDRLNGGKGDDLIDGDNGDNDTAIFSGNVASYTFKDNTTYSGPGTYRPGIKVIGPDGKDTLEQMEYVEFDDGRGKIIFGSPFDNNKDPDDPATNSANDALIGTDGHDIIIGLGGDDILTGGLGRDTFIWTKQSLVTSGAPIKASQVENDIITDFNKAQGDVINLADLLALGGNEVIAQSDDPNKGFNNYVLSAASILDDPDGIAAGPQHLQLVIKNSVNGSIQQTIDVNTIVVTSDANAATILNSLIADGFIDDGSNNL